MFGYRGLQIDLWMSAASLKAFVQFEAETTMKGRTKTLLQAMKDLKSTICF